MISRTIEQLIAAPGVDSDALLHDGETDPAEQSLFWVDWREADDSIIEYCESVLNTGTLAPELGEQEEELHILYKGKRSRVPLTISGADRHITLLALNEAMAGDYEIRMVWASNGGDTLAFAALKMSEWSELEQRHGAAAVDAAFFKLGPSPDVFQDSLSDHEPKRAKAGMEKNGTGTKKAWWKLWE